MAWSVSWSVTLDGANMTDRWNPYLTSIEVSDKDGTASDTANLTFDDSDGQCILPSNGGRVVIALEGMKVFEGTVDEVRSTGARGQGRLLTVSCKGFDSRGKVKEPQDFHKDDATLQAFMDDAAKRAGLKSVRIDPDFAQIRRDYWSADSESFIHLGERIARELGGTFKIQGRRCGAGEAWRRDLTCGRRDADRARRLGRQSDLLGHRAIRRSGAAHESPRAMVRSQGGEVEGRGRRNRRPDAAGCDGAEIYRGRQGHRRTAREGEEIRKRARWR